MIFYALGLFTTVFIMYTFQAAQPALLYLVPACLGSVLVLAVIRGELKDLWNYSEESVETHNPVDEKKKDNSAGSSAEQKNDVGKVDTDADNTAFKLPASPASATSRGRRASGIRAGDTNGLLTTPSGRRSSTSRSRSKSRSRSGRSTSRKASKKDI